MKLFMVLFMVYGSLICPPSAWAQDRMEAQIFNSLENSTYRLLEHLPIDGEALLIEPQTYSKHGIWTEDRFIFPGSDSSTDIIMGRDKINDKPIDIIKLQLKSLTHRQIHFSQLATPKRITLMFKMAPSEGDVQQGNAQAAYVKVMLGRRLLDRVRISMESGWVKKEFRVTNAQFIKKKMSLRLALEADGDNVNMMMFGFIN